MNGAAVGRRVRGGKHIHSTPMNTQNSDLLTKHEVARSLKLCVRSVDNLMTARRLAYIRIGRAVRFERSEIERFKKTLTVQAAG